MGIFSGVKKVASHMFDYRVDRWVAWDTLKSTTKEYQKVVEGLATPERPQVVESFEDAMLRMGLTEYDIQQRQIEFTRLYIFFIVLALSIVGYGIYMAFMSHMVSALISFCIAIYSLTQAFRFNFWLFQVKHRKLGCTVKEWLDGKIFAEIGQSLVPKKTARKKLTKSSEADNPHKPDPPPGP